MPIPDRHSEDLFVGVRVEGFWASSLAYGTARRGVTHGTAGARL